jgi:hypothetical protein
MCGSENRNHDFIAHFATVYSLNRCSKFYASLHHEEQSGLKLFAAPRWAYFWILIALFLTAIPHIIGLLQSDPDKSFTAIVQEPAGDVHAYYSAMVQGNEGHILYTIPFSSLDFRPVPLYTMYTAMGIIADGVGISNGLIFQVTRLLFAFLFLLAAYQVIDLSLEQPHERKLAFGILLFTQGIGWLFSIIYAGADGGIPPNLHVDLWYDEVSGYGTIIDLPHFPAISFFMIWMILAGIKALETNQRSQYGQAMLAGVGVAIIHNFRLLPIGLILGVYGLVLWREKSDQLWRVMLKVGTILLPAALYAAYIYLQLINGEYFSTTVDQAEQLTPPIWAWFVTYGPITVLTLLGLYMFYRQRPRQLVVVIIWFFAIFVLLYLPTSFQRRFGATFHIPVAILAAYGWYHVAIPRKTPRFVLMTCLVLAGMSVVFSVLINATAPGRSENTFRDADQQRIDHWLMTHTDEQDIVFAAYPVGDSLPAFVPIRTFVGHLALSPYAEDRIKDTETFFDVETSDETRIEMLRDHGLITCITASTSANWAIFSRTTLTI